MGEAEERLADAVGEAMYGRDRASQELGMTIDEVRPGFARVQL